MNVLLVAGGILQDPSFLRHKIDAASYGKILAVDHGYDHCMALGFTPDVLLGDLDSVSTGHFCCKTIAFPPEKDDTDLRLALDYALTQGASSIDILCATGGRLDQFLGNLSLLEYLHTQQPNLPARMLDERNCICLRSSNHGWQEETNASRYVSLIPLTEQIVFSCQGLKYPADHLTVSRQDMISISNEAIRDTFRIAVHSGKAYLIQAD